MMNMEQRFCRVCGTELIKKESKYEGILPYCPKCEEYRYELFNTAVSMVVVNEETDQILLIKQYGRPFYVLVAGYVNKGEAAEDAVLRELKEETGMTADRIEFNRTEFFPPSQTLMLNFRVFVKNDKEMSPNGEVDSWTWFAPEEAKKNIKEGSLAQKFLNDYLQKMINLI